MSVQIQTVIDQKAFLDSVQKGINMANQRLKNSASKIKLNIDDKGFRQPLGRITGDLKMFDSALAASNARVIAFGASTAVIGGISRAFRDLAKSTIEVEKAFTDINRILKLTNKQFDNFSNQLFDVGKKNAASFNDLTKAALEFSRQGLSVEQVAKRTSDALTLVRLTGINADKAVSSLTATVNAFEGTMLNTTEAVNKFVAVETKFAVGARDLVEALGRVGSSAQDAKVGFDELNAIVTSVQQTTGRGGAVIGNAMKTIFTRLQRQDTLDALESYGVAVRDVEGQTLPAIRILQNFAKTYSTLADSSQSYLREQVAGVFQGNILSAVLKDLTKQTSTYSKALDISRNATNEADQATAKLNQTLASLQTQAALEFKKLQANLGKSIFEPAAKALLEPLMTAMETINEILDGEGTGSDFARGLLKGIGNLLSGPGLITALGGIGVVFINTTKYILKAIPALVGITTETQKRANLEEYIQNVMAKEANIAQSLLGYEGNIAEQAKILAGYAEMTAQDMERQQRAVTNIAAQMLKMPNVAGAANVVMGGKRGGGRRAAGGFIPGVAGEVHDIKRGVGGVSRSSKPVAIPNFAFGGGVRGTMIANTGEYIVPNYSNGGSAIFNPNMVAQYGMPKGARPIRGAQGYIPNFAGDVNRALSILDRFKPGSSQYNRAAGLLSKTIDPSTGTPYVAPSTLKQGPTAIRKPLEKKAANRNRLMAASADASSFAAMLVPQVGANRKHIHEFKTKDTRLNAGFLATGRKGVELNALMYDVYGPSPSASKSVSKGNVHSIEKILDEALVNAATQVIRSYDPALTGQPVNKQAVETEFLREGGAGAMESFKGALFEALVQRIIGNPIEKGKDRTTTLDVNFSGSSGKKAANFFGIKLPPKFGDVKSNFSPGNTQKFTEQVLKNLSRTGTVLPAPAIRGASGYIPNFAALGDAVEREAAAGVPLSSIRVNRSSKLVSPNNPAGLAVTNRRDEPNGLTDVMRSSRGYVPNFAVQDYISGPRGGVIQNTQKLQQIQERLATILQQTLKDQANQNKTTEELTAIVRQRVIAERKQTGVLKNLTIDQTKLEAEIRTEITQYQASNPAATSAIVGGGGAVAGGSRMARFGAGLRNIAANPITQAASFALPSLISGFTDSSTTQSAAMGASYGSMAGMIAGTVIGGPTAPFLAPLLGNLAGALVGSLVGSANKASDALGKLTQELDDFNTETQQSVSAGQQYIDALEEAARATNESELMAAQKRIAENFEAIRGTELEKSFSAAGTNVDSLTSALQKYEAGRLREGIVKNVGVGFGEAKFVDPETGKQTAEFTKKLESLQRQTEFEQGRAQFGKSQLMSQIGLTPAEKAQTMADLDAAIANAPNVAYQEAGINKNRMIEKTIKDAEVRFSKLSIFFKDLTDEDYGTILQASKKGLDEFATSLYALGNDKVFFDSIKQIKETFGNLFEEDLQTEDYRNLIFENFKRILASASEGVAGANQDYIDKIRESIESFADVKKAILSTAREFEKVLAASKQLTKAEEAYVGQRANLLRGVGMEIRALDLEAQFSSQKFNRQLGDAVRELYNKQVLSISEFLRKEALQSKDIDTSKLNELQTMFARGDVEGAIAGYREFTPNIVSENTKVDFENMVASLESAYEMQAANIALDRTIVEARQTIERKKAENLEVERRLSYDMDKMLLKREKMVLQEDYNRQRNIVEIQARLNDPATFRNMRPQDTITGRYILESEIRRDEFKGKKSQALEQGLQKTSEIIAQENVIKSNYDLIEADKQLEQALLKAADHMARAMHNAAELTNKIRFEDERDAKIKELEKTLTSDIEQNVPIQLDIEDLKRANYKGKEYTSILPDTSSQEHKSSRYDFEQNQARAKEMSAEFQSILDETNDINELLRQIRAKEIELMELDHGQNTELLRRISILKDELEIADTRIEQEQSLINLGASRKYDTDIREAQRGTKFMAGLEDGFGQIYKESETIFYRLGTELPLQFRDGMVSAMEAAMDGTENFGDALQNVALEFLGTMRRAMLQSAVSNMMGMMGMPMGFGRQQGGIIKARNGMYISGNRSGDRNPALLEDGEYVLNKNAVRAMGGKTALDKLNFSMAPRFADGGSMVMNESVDSSRMSGFFLASDNPELEESREAARAKYEAMMRRKAEKKAKKKQMKSMILSTLISAGMMMGTGALAGAFAPKPTPFVGPPVPIPPVGNPVTNFGLSYNRSGGLISSGFGNKDSVPAFLAGGEYVMNNKAVRKYGLGFMGRLNGGLIPRMQNGGSIGAGQTVPPLSGQSGSTTNNISINVSTGGGNQNRTADSQGNMNADKQSGDTSGDDAKNLAERIRAAVIQVIQEEQRLGGSLNKNTRSK